jgi:HAD superfamily hydrolase (TIGR01509 family)
VENKTGNLNSQPIRTVLFDLDGTLIDQFNALYKAFAYTLKQLNMEIPPFHEVKRMIGGTMRQTMRMLVGDEKLEEAAGIFREYFSSVMTEDLNPLPGAEQLIQILHTKGYQVAVHTNKHGPTARAVCDFLNWTRWFAAVQGAEDTPWRKPDIECTKVLMKTLGCAPETTIMIGDSPFDIATGRNAGMRCYTVATGTHTLEELAADNPDGNYTNLIEFARDIFDLHIA